MCVVSHAHETRSPEHLLWRDFLQGIRTT
ncbi:hypothetical protein Ocin01_19434 [Orchesella cincta]|uniref:Uncharacterized protein n=1 Tax=Orchesella cincta TaxID=48709 RepID=A0A1D2M2Q3_ORCCI|nr:hypothetical protein Ocin01_19434 [Orchesella cincta]